MLNWVVGNLNSNICIVLILYGLTQNGSTQRSNALLTINKNLLTNRAIAVFELDIWTLPGNDISNWEAIIKAVNKFGNLVRFPHKRSLNFWYCNLAHLHHAEQIGYEELIY